MCPLPLCRRAARHVRETITRRLLLENRLIHLGFHLAIKFYTVMMTSPSSSRSSFSSLPVQMPFHTVLQMSGPCFST
jgi:hypothetical protein